jgi:hypothetical protein
MRSIGIAARASRRSQWSMSTYTKADRPSMWGTDPDRDAVPIASGAGEAPM